VLFEGRNTGVSGTDHSTKESMQISVTAMF